MYRVANTVVSVKFSLVKAFSTCFVLNFPWVCQAITKLRSFCKPLSSRSEVSVSRNLMPRWGGGGSGCLYILSRAPLPLGSAWPLRPLEIVSLVFIIWEASWVTTGVINLNLLSRELVVVHRDLLLPSQTVMILSLFLGLGLVALRARLKHYLQSHSLYPVHPLSPHPSN